MADPDLQKKGRTCRSLMSPAGTKAGPEDNIFWTVTGPGPVERSLVVRPFCEFDCSRRCHSLALSAFFVCTERGSRDHRFQGRQSVINKHKATAENTAKRATVKTNNQGDSSYGGTNGPDYDPE
ncbi:MAG TPA: hypothetical protein DIU35_19110 [Candidatus Latescibacteria bacterium]|nr:hypothetical protein [Candidatus Latescibacterota bacterium]|tara:strand:- start:53 stop:424 length:372 start_codon:yes stop_codon:yes gene_type:complete